MAKLPIAILSFCIALLAGARRAQGAASASTCSNGFEGIDGNNQHGNVCCPLGCNQCGGPGCGSNGDPGFGNKECCPNGILANQGSCALTGAAPCFIVNHRTCSNGIVGIDGSNKSGDKVCCPIQCNQCGGPGCGVSGHVGFGNKECCPNGVVANQEDCAVTGTAPCVITEDSSLLPGMPGEAQTSVKEPLESGCQDHGGINRFYSDGYCDAVNNNKWCLWDGGDCCEESCRDGAEYLCVDNVFECVDPKFVIP